MIRRLAWFPSTTAIAIGLLQGCGGPPGDTDASPLDRLPALPAFVYQNDTSIAVFRDADRLARQAPLSAERIGRLGMTYHAYQFMHEARLGYALARMLAPDDYRWVYYSAFLEKAVFNFTASEDLFNAALAFRPDSAEVWAELGDMYLMWNRPDEAATHLARALELDPTQPAAALGQARLALLEEDWERAIALLTPILDVHPRLSLCHKYLARAYSNLGRGADQAYHRSRADYGSAIETPLMRELHELSVEAIVEGGDPSSAEAILAVKCTRCHTSGRIEATNQDRRWWARTVRRMQREAGWAWLSDGEAASVVAFLAARGGSPALQRGPLD